MLRADIDTRMGAFHLDVSLTAAAGTTLAVVGPNGAGKTSLLRTLAGLLPVNIGHVSLFDRVLDDSADHVHLPAERRSVGVMFQDYRLFPHLSALDNVAFGLVTRGLRRREARIEAAAWLARVGLGDRAAATPASLSGGEAQRVALARALAPRPEMLLLDEPLSALDAALRAEFRRDLQSELRSFEGVRVMVTHDPLEAMAIADTVAVIEAGGVAQFGSPSELAARPRTPYVAQLVGVNLFRGRATGTRVVLDGGGVLEVSTPSDDEVFAVVHPTAVAIHLSPPEGTPRNVWPARIEGMERLGSTVWIRAETAVAEPGRTHTVLAAVTMASADSLHLAPGRDVWLSFKATEVEVYPA